MEGEVDISSSRSGEGEAFRFLEGPEEDTGAIISLSLEETFCLSHSLDLLGERRECSWK